MGVYLSSPVTDKVSEDKQCDIFTYGASSMQGWRMTQEDSHNCIPDFDVETKTSLFAVYDGHGGSEVAKYCSVKLPDFIKGVEQYKNSNLSTCLQEAFLGFDETLTHEDVIKELKALAGDDDGEDDEDEKDHGESDQRHGKKIMEISWNFVEEADAIAVRKEADILYEEATMPIEELRAKYSGNPLLQQNKHLKGQKQPSPMIRAKRTKQLTGNGSTESVKEQLDLKEENEHPDNDNNLNTEKELNETKSSTSESEQQDCKSVKSDVNDNKCEAAVSSSSEPTVEEVKTVNHSDSIEVSNDTVSTSSKDIDAVSMESSSASSSGSSGSSGISSEAASSSSAGDVPSSTSSEGTSSSSGVDSEPSGSGEPGSSGVSGSSKKSGLTLDDLDSDDDDSSDEDEAYNSEDYEDVDGEDDDEDDEEEDDGPALFRYVKDDEDQPDEEPGSGSGCTAVVALLRDRELVVANAGDSRCVLCRDGKAIDLSVDHKPEDKPEKDRIEAAGGQVTEDGRVNGGLNLSRAIGDHYYKKNISIEAKDQMISAYPDVEHATLEDKDEFMVLACDGIWNYMTSQEVVDYVRERLKDEKKCNKPSLICEEMFDHCLAPNTCGDGTGCDNMTCIIVVFKQNHSNNKKHDLDSSGLSEPPEKRQRTDEEVPS